MTQRKTHGQRRWTRWYPKKRDDSIIARWADACSRNHSDCGDCELRPDCEDLADRLISCMAVPSPLGPGNRVHPVRSAPQKWSGENWLVEENSDNGQRKRKECRIAR